MAHELHRPAEHVSATETAPRPTTVLGQPSTMPSFFRRPLPESCIAFDSDRGKELFKKAMQEGNMEKYFRLAQSFLTQNEPAYCGLATLCMILNALDVDPQKQFKGPWRYYSQEMLDCCRNLDDVAKSGITLAEFACLARCNGLYEHTRYGTFVSKEEFVADIKRVSGQDDGSIMAVAYSRKSLGQTGDGHFSPVGGYCEAEGKVLIMDVARFKYPSYWVSVDDLFSSMEAIDKATGQPRGYSVIRVKPAQRAQSDVPESGLLSLNFNKQSWPQFLRKFMKLEAQEPEQLVDKIIGLLHGTGSEPLAERTITAKEIKLAEEQQQLDPTPTKILLDVYDREVRHLVAALEDTTAWKLVSTSLQHHPAPFQSPSEYPQALNYALFMSALLTSSAPPAQMREIWQSVLDADQGIPEDERKRVHSEVAFLQGQMSSLQKCCGSEAVCTCKGKGVSSHCSS